MLLLKPLPSPIKAGNVPPAFASQAQKLTPALLSPASTTFQVEPSQDQFQRTGRTVRFGSAMPPPQPPGGGGLAPWAHDWDYDDDDLFLGWNALAGVHGEFKTHLSATQGAGSQGMFSAARNSGDEAEFASQHASATNLNSVPQADPYAGLNIEEKITIAKQLVDSGTSKREAARQVNLGINKLCNYKSQGIDARSASAKKRNIGLQTGPYAGWSPEERLEKAKQLVDSGTPKWEAATKVGISNRKLSGYKSQGTKASQDRKNPEYQSASGTEGYSSTGLTDPMGELIVKPQKPVVATEVCQNFNKTGKIDISIPVETHRILIQNLYKQAAEQANDKIRGKILVFAHTYDAAFNTAFPVAQHREQRVMSTAGVSSLNWEDQQNDLPARPVTPPNSWSHRFANLFKRPDETYSDPANPDDPAYYPDFQGYAENGRPLFAIYRPDESFAGYSQHPQLRGG